MRTVPAISPVEDSKIDLSRLETACAARHIELPKSYKSLITRLLTVHFVGKLSVKPNGDIELAIPDPTLLCNDGPKEINSKHLYVNLTKYLEHEHKFAARCVKTGMIYDIDLLKTMEPLQDRKVVLGWDPKKYMEIYSAHSGRLFISPLSYSNLTEDLNDSTKDCLMPGKLIPVTELKDDHPAKVYLKSRGFNDMKALYDQFELSFCSVETPQWKHLTTDNTEDTLRNYKVDPLGFSPQGKLIFFVKQFGVYKTWQARLIETVIGNDKFLFNWEMEDDPKGMFNKWVHAAVLNPETGKFEALNKKFKATLKRKYIICPGTLSSNCLMGFDAALEWNKKNRPNPWDQKVIGIAEGPLDAARMGPPFCAIMGSTLSLSQMKLISNNFGKLLYARDHDDAGKSMKTKLEQYLDSLIGVEVVEMEYPEQFKDLGSIMDENVVKTLKEKYNLYGTV